MKKMTVMAVGGHIGDMEINPKIYFEVTPQGYAKWQELISLHWFTVNSTSFRHKKHYSSLMSGRGIEARKDYAQTFMIPPMAERRYITEFQ